MRNSQLASVQYSQRVGQSLKLQARSIVTIDETFQLQASKALSR